jgi:hypothetical protein
VTPRAGERFFAKKKLLAVFEKKANPIVRWGRKATVPGTHTGKTVLPKHFDVAPLRRDGLGNVL